MKNFIQTDEKYLYKVYDLWVSKLLRQGVFFFSLTMNISTFYLHSQKEFIFTTNEEIIVWIKNFFGFCSGIDFIDFIFGSFDTNLGEGNTLVNCILGFRSHLNSNNFIKEKIEERLIKLLLFDYTLLFLQEFDEIAIFLKFLSKDFAKKRTFPFGFMAVYSECFLPIHEEYIVDILVENSVDFIQGFTCFHYFDWGKFCADSHIIPKGYLSEIPSIPAHITAFKDSEIIYYLLIYFYKKKIIMHQNIFYIKISGFFISYQYLGDYPNYIFDNFLNIMTELQKDVFAFLDPLSLFFVFTKHSESYLPHITRILDIFKKEISLNFLEFSDGVYIVNVDKFISRKDFSKLTLLADSYATFHYYDITYKKLSRSKFCPTVWKNKLMINLSEIEFSKFCILFRNVFFNIKEENENNIIFLLENSNSILPALIFNILFYVYGKNNIPVISSNISITLQKLQNKIVIFNKLNTTLLKKNINKIITENLSGFSFLINSNLKLRTEKIIPEGFSVNKYNIFTFEKSCDFSCLEQENLLKETPKILIYCNKLYFNSLLTEKKIRLRKQIKQVFLNKQRIKKFF
jgi:hypothetical protein